MTKASFKIKRRNAAVGGGGGTFTVTASSFGDNFFNSFYGQSPAPFGLPTRKMARTFSVPSGDSAIFLSEEILAPHSPPATSWVVGGADVGSFEAGAITGSIDFTAAARSANVRDKTYNLTVTPKRTGAPDGAAMALQIYVPPTSKEFFVSYSLGTNTTADLGTVAAPYKFLPGSADFVGTAKTFNANNGQVVFWKGEIHRTALVASKTSTLTRMAHHGASGATLYYEFAGWGGRATIDGSDIITGGVTPSQSEVGGNANYASLKKFAMSGQGGAVEWFQSVFDGPSSTANSKLYRAQWPTPATLAVSRLPDTGQALGSERYGLRTIPNATSGTRYMCTDNADGRSSGSLITIKDPGIAARYGNISASFLPKVMFIIPGNYTAELPPTTYDYATSTITISTSSPVGVRQSGNCCYAILYSPFDIVQAGQYALAPDGLTMFAWLPNNSTVSVSRRYIGAEWGQAYHRFSGGSVARFCNGTPRSGSVDVGGNGFHLYDGSGGDHYECDITNMWISQCYAEDSGVIYASGSGVPKLKNSNIELVNVSECDSHGIRLASLWFGPTTAGDYAAITSATTGKIWYNYFGPNSVNGTSVYISGGGNFHVSHNCNRNNRTLHGNCISVYDLDLTHYPLNYSNYFVLDYNDAINSSRGFTTDAVLSDRHAKYVGNLVLNSNDGSEDQNAGFNLFGGEIGGEFARNIEMNYNNNTYWNGFHLTGTGPFNIHNNVFAGLDLVNGWTGSASDNYLTCEVQVTDQIGNGGTHTGNTQLTGGSQIFQFSGITTPGMTGKLGSGPVGSFLTVA